MGSVIPVVFQALQAFQAISNVAQVVDRGSRVEKSLRWKLLIR